MKCNAQKKGDSEGFQAPLGGINGAQVGCQHPKVWLKWYPKLPTRNNNAVQADYQADYHYLAL